mgnify:CR=1 FL=1
MNRIFLVVIVIVIFYIGYIGYSDFNEFSNNIKNLKFEFIPIILLFSFIPLAILTIRQKILLKSIDIKISNKENFLLYLSGLSFIITPGGAGEAIKTYFLKKKYNHKIAKTIPLVLVEKYTDLISVITIIAIFSIIIQINEIIIAMSVIGIVTLITYITIRIKKMFELGLKILKKIKPLSKFTDTISESYEGIYLMTSPKIMLKSCSISISVWSIEAIAIYLVFLSFNTDIGFIQTTLIMYSSVIIGAVSLLPAGIGVTEVSATHFLLKEGLEISLVTSIVFIVRLTSIWFATAIGFIASKIIWKKI